ncbi:MAG: large subunit ribosomal protein [Clostridiales bacterium]|nr:large subunit ribosomal protein [Clostridiales bacterium]MDK2934507.1 large subunit ribosomal protein [Clostridiales bacterium]
MSTYMAKANEMDRKWYIIDADSKPLGRVAAQVAKILRGKHKPTYTPHVDSGDHVIVINADKVILTGRKLDQKYYRRHTGYVGGLKEIKYRELLKNNPEKAITLAVKGMVPRNSLGRAAMKKLRVYKGTEHDHQAQKPEVWTQEL